MNVFQSLSSTLHSFYNHFPLYTLTPPSSSTLVPSPSKPVLCIAPRLSADSTPYPWVSSDPNSLRFQLLFLLAGVDVEWKDWETESAAPEGKLPALVLPNQLVPLSKVRAWLDSVHPLYSAESEFHGYPNATVEAQARAFGRLASDKLYPAYVASRSSSHTTLSKLAVMLPTPPALLAGLSSPLPSVGQIRRLDLDAIKRDAVEAVKALAVKLSEDESHWFLGCLEPTPLDCLIVSHLFLILHTLPTSNPIRRAIEADKALLAYIQRFFQKVSPSSSM